MDNQFVVLSGCKRESRERVLVAGPTSTRPEREHVLEHFVHDSWDAR